MKDLKKALNLIYEIANGEHKGFEMDVCQDFIDNLNERIKSIIDTNKDQAVE